MTFRYTEVFQSSDEGAEFIYGKVGTIHPTISVNCAELFSPLSLNNSVEWPNLKQIGKKRQYIPLDSKCTQLFNGESCRSLSVGETKVTVLYFLYFQLHKKY